MLIFFFLLVVPQPQTSISGDGFVLTITGIGSITQEISKEKGFLSVKHVKITEASILDTSAFSQFEALESISLPKKMVSFGSSCFYMCQSLKNITIPEGIEIIHSATFFHCFSLSYISFPSTLKEISLSDVFYRCYKLSYFDVSNDNLNFSTDTNHQFLLDKQGTTLRVCPAIENVVIPKNAKIMSKQFANDNQISNLDFSESTLEIIRDSALIEIKLDSLVLPQTIQRIEGLFKSCEIASLTIPSSLTYFADNALSSVTGLKSMNVGTNPRAFQTENEIVYNSDKSKIYFIPPHLDTLIIPLSVTKIDFPLIRSENLVNVTVLGDHSKFKSEQCILYDKDGSTLLACPGGLKKAVVRDGCQTVGEYSFSGVQTEEIFLSSSVNLIDSRAFSKMKNLTKINIPLSLSEIRGYAFLGTIAPNVEFVFQSNLKTIGFNIFVSANVKKIDLSLCDKVQRLPGYFFRNTVVNEVILPKSLTEIGPDEFINCRISSELVFPPSLSIIGVRSFYNSFFKSIKIGEGFEASLKSINQSSFEHSSIESFDVPKNVVSFENGAFKDCYNLKHINIPRDSKLARIKDSAISNCKLLEGFYISSMVESIAPGAFAGSVSISEFTFDPNNKYFHVQDGVLITNGTTLHSFPGGVECGIVTSKIQKILMMAFLRCSKLVNVKFQKGCGVTAIHESTFSGCTNLKNVVLSGAKDLVGIEESAFSDCRKLKSIDLSNKLQYIKSSAFSGCSSLLSVKIPLEIKEIGDLAFFGCESLVAISFCGIRDLEAGAGKDCFHGVACNVVSVMTNYKSQTFCGMRVLPVLDSDCHFGTSVFTGTDPSQCDILCISSLLVECSDA